MISPLHPFTLSPFNCMLGVVAETTQLQWSEALYD